MRLRKPAISSATLLPCIAVAALIAIVVRQNLLQAELEWKPFSKAEIYVANARGQVVLVSFVADWNPTCSLNQATLFGDKSTSVQRTLREQEVALLLADYTEHDPVVKAELNQLGFRSTPAIAIYAPGAAPIVLRDLISEEQLLAALQTAVENRKRR